MSITYVRGNLFASPAQTLVNTVNTEGVMGKGVALEFKRLFPEMFEEYHQLCERRQLKIGMLHVYRTPHKWVLNFPTKTIWRQPSRVEYIEAGLKKLVEIYAKIGIQSLAMPPIGCGNGQLEWSKQVGPLIHQYLENLPIPVYVYPARPTTILPEHLDVEGMRQWLRTEPAALPFDAVWEDVVRLVGGTRKFSTSTTKSSYFAWAQLDPPSLSFETEGGKKHTVGHGDLLDFWQQLRRGIAFRTASPEFVRWSYLAPVFEQLPYVHRIDVATSGDGLERQPSVALQVIPPKSPAEPDDPLFRHQVG